MSACPNKNSQDWKDLVDAIGENAAYRAFIMNDHVVPRIMSQDIDYNLGNKHTDQTTIEEILSDGEVLRDTINAITDEFPGVVINRDALFDENGNLKSAEELGTEGQKIVEAIKDIMFWSQGDMLETPPGHNAVQYLRMFGNVKSTKELVDKVGSDKAIKLIENGYVDGISKADKKLLNNFWSGIASKTATDKSMEPLVKSVVKNIERIQRYQHNDPNRQAPEGVLRRMRGSLDFDNANTNFSEELSKEIGENFVQLLFNHDPEVKALADKIDAGQATESDVIALLDKYLIESKNDYRANANEDTAEHNKLHRDKLHDVEEGIFNVFEKLLGKDVPVTQTESDLYNVFKRKMTTMIAEKESYGKVLAGEGRMYNANEIVESISRELSDTSQKKSESKGIIARLGKFLEQNKGAFGLLNVNKLFSMKTNSVLLSGSSNSTFTRMVYDHLNEADGKKGAIMHLFDKAWSVNGNGVSVFDTQSKKSTDVAHKVFSVKNKEGADVRVTVTDAEMVSMYLIDRQKQQAIYNGKSPSQALRLNGVTLRHKGLKDRDASTYGKPLKFTPEQLNEINKHVSENYPEVINSVDRTFAALLPEVNDTHMTLHGIPVSEEADYFPVSYGEEKTFDQAIQSQANSLGSTITRIGSSKPVMIKDVFEVMQISKNAMSHYAAVAVPQRNIEMIFNQQNLGNPGLITDEKEMRYLNQIKSQIDRFLDPKLSWSNASDEKTNQFLQKLNSNFAVTVLSFNNAVTMKQMVSINTAAQYIDRQDLNKAAFGKFGITLVPATELRKWLTWKPKETFGEKGAAFPLQWLIPENNPLMQTMMKYSGKAASRFSGLSDRELESMAKMEQAGKDMIQIKIFGRKFKLSRHRLMMGIQAMDTLTVMKIWDAIELETKRLHPALQEGTDEYYEHVAMRWEEVVEQTQPTSSSLNRVDIHNSQQMVARFMTMFGSATSKIGDTFGYELAKTIANPTRENKKSMIKFLTNVMLTQPILLVSIDLLVRAIEGLDFPDEEELKEYAVPKLIGYQTGMFFGVRDIAGAAVGKIWDKPWLMETTVPPIDVFNQFKLASSQLIEGYGKPEFGRGEEWLYDDALRNLMEVTMKTGGLPIKPLMVYDKIMRRIKEISEDE